MKKEIEVWVGIHCEQHINEGIPELLKKDISSVAFPEAWMPAKLIIEIPEKKIEITESQFMKKIKDIVCHSTNRSDYVVVDQLIEELFGGKS